MPENSPTRRSLWTDSMGRTGTRALQVPIAAVAWTIVREWHGEVQDEAPPWRLPRRGGARAASPT